ncbi:MAG: PIN domain-containing protein [Bacteroidota bacterium]
MLVSISQKSKYHWLYQALISGEFDLYITNEILTEYEEIIGCQWHPEVAKAVIRTLIKLRNVHQTSVSFRMNLIQHDADDNKFADCSFANNVHCIVTHDNHFNVLKTIDFPSIEVIDIEEFRKLLITY